MFPQMVNKENVEQDIRAWAVLSPLLKDLESVQLSLDYETCNFFSAIVLWMFMLMSSSAHRSYHQ